MSVAPCTRLEARAHLEATSGWMSLVRASQLAGEGVIGRCAGHYFLRLGLALDLLVKLRVLGNKRAGYFAGRGVAQLLRVASRELRGPCVVWEEAAGAVLAAAGVG